VLRRRRRAGLVRGARRTVTYASPNGVQERCVMLARMPGATYRPQGEAQERKSCRAGHLRFEGDPEAFLRDGKLVAPEVDCNNP
jgi:hypothetical protein